MRTKKTNCSAAAREIASLPPAGCNAGRDTRRAAYAAHPAWPSARAHGPGAGLKQKAAALGAASKLPAPPLTRADEALAAAVREAGYEENAFTPAYRCPCARTPACGAVSPTLRGRQPPAACAGRSTPPVRWGYASFPALRSRATETVEPGWAFPRGNIWATAELLPDLRGPVQPEQPEPALWDTRGAWQNASGLAIADAVLEAATLYCIPTAALAASWAGSISTIPQG